MNRAQRRAAGRNGGAPQGMTQEARIRELEIQNARLTKMATDERMGAIYTKGFTMQQMTDFALITLGDHFGFGPERAKKFLDELQETARHYIEESIEESGIRLKELTEREKALGMKPDLKAGNDAIPAVQTHMDTKLKRICGKYFQPWGTRYNEQKLFNRNRDIQGMEGRDTKL